MALSKYDREHLDRQQQQAVLTYTAQYERAIREGNPKAAQMAHEGAEAIRRRAGYSGGASGSGYLSVPTAVSKTIATTSSGSTTYQTAPRSAAINTERADELDKRNVPSASRQARVGTAERQGRGGGFSGGRTQPSVLTRLGLGITSGLAQSGAEMTAVAGTLMDTQGGTAMSPVYQEQKKALDQQITVLERELRDPTLTARERQDTNDALQIARGQRDIYAQATAANESTAKKLYETADEGLRYAREQGEKSVRGTSGTERELLSLIPGVTQGAAIMGLNLLAPGLGTTAAVLADAGAAETQYRRESGADYDAATAGALGAQTIGSAAAQMFGQALLRDYAETLRGLYAEKRRQAEQPRLLTEPDEPRSPQSAYEDALSRLEAANGADLTKPVSAYDVPQIISSTKAHSYDHYPWTFGSEYDNIIKQAQTAEFNDEYIGRSLGAKARNYDILDLETGEHYHLAEGTRLGNVETFAGGGTKKEYRKAAWYSSKYGGDINAWQHVKGVGIVDTPDGQYRAELHWSECKGVGKFDMFIKRWLE